MILSIAGTNLLKLQESLLLSGKKQRLMLLPIGALMNTTSFLVVMS